jgi:Tol biopolymer transport system component/DNA-binding winged helix-turn-helix (wHTH) protein
VSTSSSPPLSANFDQFHVDFTSGELIRSGVRVPIQGQPFHVLRLLLEADGKVVTREELRQALWPENTFVDFELGVNTAVKKLRQSLEDSAEHPRFIETLPRYGYRIIVPVEWVTGNNDKISAGNVIQLSGDTDRRPNWLKIGAGFLFVTACVTILLSVSPNRQPRTEQSAPTPIPLTAFPGLESAPTFSPDGTQVAFAWTGDPATGSKGFDLYLKGFGSEKVLRLTNHPSQWICAAWSPDGTQIAFHRISGADTGLYVVPALGGPERKLRSTSILSETSAAISWSPDGKSIAFSDLRPDTRQERLYLLSLETLKDREIPNAENCEYTALPAFSHDGKQLAYNCAMNSLEEGIYSVAIEGGAPRRIATISGWASSNAWTGDDHSLVFTVDHGGGGELFELTLADGSSRKLPFGQGFAWPAISRKGDKLAFTTSSDNINIWRKDLRNPESVGVKLVASTREQTNPNYSPDGKHIAFESTRSGAREIWISDADGSNMQQISRFNSNVTGTPSWSPDGKKIVFDSWHTGNPEGYIVDVSELIPRKLVTNILGMFQPSWSHDGEWIYFLSGAIVAPRVHRWPTKGGNAAVLSSEPAFGFHEAFDGETLYFVDAWADAILKKVSVNQVAPASRVAGMPPLKDAALWTVVPEGIYFVPADAPRAICYFDFAKKQVRRIMDVDQDFNSRNGGLSVSPDGRWVLYAQVDDVSSDIMVVDHFR